ncbi:MAG: DNA replication/repair protein RecF [Saprospiraceae bacterium]|nr:DNA replication/repair protein RecF [Saprospiraceae bacterium]
MVFLQIVVTYSVSHSTFAPMHLEKIILTNFKNYANQTLVFDLQFNAFVGLNGVGKTNLLDAIYYLCMCKSYFLSSDSDTILRGADFMRLEGIFKKNSSEEKIAAKVQPRKKKIFERHDVPYSALSEHIGLIPIVMIAPDDTELIKEGSEERRRFLDNTLSQLDKNYLNHLIFYNRVLEQRNSLLKKYANNEGGQSQELDSLLGIYEIQLLPAARYIFQKRHQFIQEFEPIFNETYQKISGAKESVKIVFDSQLNSILTKKEGVDTSELNLWLASRAKDKILQRTTFGIHRDDLGFEMGDKSVKKFGSQGQLKSFVIALKLAQYEILRGSKFEQPILLLDDIFDKLDEERVNNLLQLIVSQSYGQVFITDTHEERIKAIFETTSIHYKLFQVASGQVQALTLI